MWIYTWISQKKWISHQKKNHTFFQHVYLLQSETNSKHNEQKSEKWNVADIYAAPNGIWIVTIQPDIELLI